MFEWAVQLIEKTGYWGVGLGMIFENIFPPIPSELIMSFAGAAAGRGALNVFGVLIVGSIGSVLGLLPWYYAGKRLGIQRVQQFVQKHGRLLTLPDSDIRYAQTWFESHGKRAVFIGRFIPIVRTLIAIPAAVTNMHFGRFLLYAFMGSVCYDGIFVGLGYFFGENFELLRVYLNTGTNIIVALIIAYYLYRVITFKNDS